MKKLFTIFLCLFTLIGCTKKEVPNPFSEYTSLNEINDKADVHIVPLNNCEIEKENFYMIENNTASYVFVINGIEYYIRGVRDTGNDMSGIIIDGHLAFEGSTEDIDYRENEEYKVFRFILDNTQYIFGVHDYGKVNQEEFFNQFYELYGQIIEASTKEEVKQYIGYYEDCVSMRAGAVVRLNNVNTLLIDIIWSSSADEYDEWVTEGKIKNNKIEYKNIAHTKNKINGEEVEILSTEEGQAGYFEIIDNKICWTGSGNEQTSICEFIKIKQE